MRAIWKYFVDFHHEVKHPVGLYVWMTLFITILTFINYSVRMEKWMDRLKPAILPYVAHFIMFAFIYFVIVFLCYRYRAIPNVFKSRAFMLKSFFMLLLLSVDVSFHFHREVVKSIFEVKDRYFMYKVTSQINSIFVMLIPLIIYYIRFEKTNDNFYGLKASAKNISQYFPLILLMIPLIFAASFESSFQDYYPRFKESAQFLDWSVQLRATVFEIFYAVDFLFTELLFRGLMVLGFTAFLGPRAILPMVGLYVALHYGKPLGETIGSFFGGYILGVLAYQSRNIWGGIIAHMGVALLMELAAWWQKVYNS
ncbi:CPBP family intramembrane metalloprotease [Marivirga sp. S37H4]|uniref:CPBP family intramembrane metalloprotease n=1 Tax=Marivirga aurantiaca TaxID=2802615 RepID=A0A934WYE0_9BACT|nr:CPBP family intramembrane glutamic endopeptidase [Marivirga aurantiaca]MBK6265070.1 CPBP family intramembrane metalloprotease [Marivirga aurantiaca]